MVGVFAVEGSVVKWIKETLAILTTGRCGPNNQEASVSSPPGADKLTARPGTMVEMACL
jgi:hypothetical protein